VSCIAFSPDGQLLFVGSANGTARLWEVSSGGLRELEGYTGWIKSVVFSPDGRLVLTDSFSSVKAWEVSSGRLVWEVNYQGQTDPSHAMFSPDGQRVLADYGGTIRFWEAESGRKLPKLNCTGTVNGISFSPDGRLAAIYTQEGRVYFCRAQEPDLGKPLGIYVAAYEVGAVYWQQNNHLVLADKGGPMGRPHFYQVALEGRWE
jgi:WD40 repeat protein